MRKIIAEIDKISQYIEDFEEPWSFNVAWRLDRVAQQLEELISKESFQSNKTSKKVLSQYMGNMSFPTENRAQVSELIKKQSDKKASEIYSSVKNYFGGLNKAEAMKFIKNTLKEI